MNWKITALICAGIFALAGFVLYLIFSTEPRAERTAASKETAMLVDVVPVEKGDYFPVITAMGTVVPVQDVIVRPRVGGEVVALSESFIPGGFVQKGETLLRIDPSDYENILRQRKSELEQAEADLRVEMGQQDIARKDYQVLGESLEEEQKALVLRQPQLDMARAKVESARAAVDQARLDLKRTEIKAPFDAHILSREVNLGSQVSAGDALARLVGLEAYWVEATVPLSSLAWISFPQGSDEKGSEVLIRDRAAWEPGVYRKGELSRFLGALEDRTRMARVLITVEDPLSLENGSGDKPGLIIGSFVEARIKAREIEDVVKLERDYVREDDTVWVMKEDSLDIRDVGIIFRDAQHAYIQRNLEEGERVVTTNLATVVQGVGLRLKQQGDASSSAGRESLSGHQNNVNATRKTSR